MGRGDRSVDASVLVAQPAHPSGFHFLQTARKGLGRRYVEGVTTLRRDDDANLSGKGAERLNGIRVIERVWTCGYDERR